MAAGPSLPLEERILRLLKHLGLEQAHFAARVPRDWRSLVVTHPEVVSSLTLVCPRNFQSSPLRGLASRLLVASGDQGSYTAAVRPAMAELPGATLVTLPDYFTYPTSDVAADRTEDLSSALTNFLERVEQGQGSSMVTLPEGEGEVAGIRYRVRGSGPPLVLLPLEWAPSQWEPLIPMLGERYCTITLGGAELGVIATLEERAGSAWYLEIVGNLIDDVKLRPGDTVLDVGCGTGVLDRWLAHRTSKASPITAMDISPYLLREAAALAQTEGVGEVIDFQEGNGEDLPFPDSSFDLTLSITVIGYGDAGRILAEMVRVTKPQGRIAVIERATDIPFWVNVHLRADLKTKAEAAASASVANNLAERGCADASLYRRFRQAGLSHLRMQTQMAAYDDTSRVQELSESLIIPALSLEEAAEWREALAQAEKEGVLFLAQPFHCAAATKL